MPWIQANGASLRYTLSGSGQNTLVLVHEAGGCLDSYDEALPYLEKHFQVLRYDQRGFGFSEKVRALDFEEVVADLAGLLDALNIHQPAYFAGCAMGADFAVGLATRHPQRVKKLVIASPSFGPNAARGPQSLERAVLVEREGIRSAMNDSHARSYPEVLRSKNQDRFNHYQARWVCNTPASFSALARMMHGIDMTPEYEKIKSPTLVLGAQYDVQRPPEIAEKVAHSIPGAIYQLTETGHFMNVQTPDLFAKTLIDFFKD